MKERRSKLQIYYDVFDAILRDQQNNGEVSNTRVQFKCNTSYDKLMRYYEEMDKKGILKAGDPIEITEEGRIFHKNYSTVSELLNEITTRLAMEN